MNHKQSPQGHSIDAKFRDDLLAYLAMRPWQEVNALIVALVRAKESTAPEAEPQPAEHLNALECGKSPVGESTAP